MHTSTSRYRFCISLLPFLLAFCPGPALANADDPSILSRYKAAYRSYQQLVKVDNFPAALPHAKEAYELGKFIHGEDSENFAALAYNYGLMLLEVGLPDRAQPLLRQALEVYEALGRGKDLQRASLLGHLGSAAAASGNRSRAVRHFDRGLAIVAEHRGKASLPYGTMALHAGIALAESGSAEAEDYLLSSYRIHKEVAGEKDAATAQAVFHLGRLYLRQGRFEKSIFHLKAALSGFENDGDASREYILLTHIDLVKAYESIGRSEAATRHCLAVGANMPEVHKKGLRPLYGPRPDIPEPARHQGEGGYVVVQFDVDDRGFVRNVEAIDIKGDEDLKIPALEAVQRYRYAPRFVNGKPVAMEGVQARLSFKPDDSG